MCVTRRPQARLHCDFVFRQEMVQFLLSWVFSPFSIQHSPKKEAEKYWVNWRNHQQWGEHSLWCSKSHSQAHPADEYTLFPDLYVAAFILKKGHEALMFILYKSKKQGANSHVPTAVTFPTPPAVFPQHQQPSRGFFHFIPISKWVQALKASNNYNLERTIL